MTRHNPQQGPASGGASEEIDELRALATHLGAFINADYETYVPPYIQELRRKRTDADAEHGPRPTQTVHGRHHDA